MSALSPALAPSRHIDRNSQPWGPWLAAALVAGLLGWSLTFWVLRWPAPSTDMPVPAMATPTVATDVNALARVLGQRETVPVVNETLMVLYGVAVGSRPELGAAVIAVNGQSARSVRVGQAVNDQWRLASVAAREAHVVSVQGQSLTLKLPAPAPATPTAPVSTPAPAVTPVR